MQARGNSSLVDVLAYHNEHVSYRFTEQYDVTLAEAESIFDSTKKWLWLSSQSETPLMITEPIAIIDEMWHNFILFTADYTHFCQQYFGVYIHHTPVSHLDKRRMASEYEQAPEEYAQKRVAMVTEQCAFIYHMLGEDTLLQWYVDYPQRYGNDFFQQKRIVKPIAWQPTHALRDIYERLQ